MQKAIALLFILLFCFGCSKERNVSPTSPHYHPSDYTVKTNPVYHGIEANYHNPACFTCHPSNSVTPATTTCAVCHGVSSVKNCEHCHQAEMLDTTIHTAHMKNMDCDKCHTGYSLHDSLVSPTSHLDGKADIVLRSTLVCVKCHLNLADSAKHYWVSGIKWPILACNVCHDVQATTGAHSKHGNAATYNYDCNVCHVGDSRKALVTNPITHANNAVDISFSMAYVDSVFGNGKGAAMSITNRNCSSVACHGFGYPDTLGITWNRAAIPWTTTLECTDCHNATGHNGGTDCQTCHAATTSDGVTISNYKMHVNGKVEATGVCGSCHAIPPATGSHTGHTDAARKVYDCGVCHSGYSKVDSTVSAANHINQVVNVDGSGISIWNGTVKTCASTYCHGNFTGGAHATPTWGSTATCGSCHTMIPATGEHSRHRSKGIACGNCHPGYVSGTTSNWSIHVNNIKDVGPFLNRSNQPVPAGAYSNGRCSNIGCHGTEDW